MFTAAAVALAAALAAQAPQISPELRDAQALFTAGKWAEAVKAYEPLVHRDARDPRPRAGLAAALYALGDYDRALPFALEASRLLDDPATQLEFPGLPPGAVMVRIARLYNRLGQVNKAMEWLEKAVAYPVPALVDTEPDMANLRAHTKWAAIDATRKANADPCANRPEFREFDFLIGDWDVLGGAGQKVGTSHVERILNGCVIFETYTAAPGTSTQANYVGNAFHFFDPNAGHWVQHYIDTAANPFDWTGDFADGVMRYTREGPFGPKNSPIKQRMTFTGLPGGKVQQLFEQSADGGRTWRAGFNGTYVKREKTGAQEGR
jgi:Tetratricopeptide repeat